MSNLEMNKRPIDVPNSAKKARRNGKVPGVLYGKKINNLLFEVGELELCHEIGVNGEHGVLEFNLDGETHKGLIKEVQRDPVTNKIIHLDLEELKGKNKIVSAVPIHYIGEEYLKSFDEKTLNYFEKEFEEKKFYYNLKSILNELEFDIDSLSEKEQKEIYKKIFYFNMLK